MDDREVGRYWDANAEAWTVLSRAGYDQSRDVFNTPGFLAMLPDVRGLAGLDVGCGEGHNTRLLAGRGARMTAVDISTRFLEYARRSERDNPLGIDYRHASAQALPIPDASFDFVTAFMSLMDIPQPERAVAEAHRVLRPGGLLQFSICHPCFQTPRWRWVRDEAGRKIGVLCGDYFDRVDGRVDEWTFGAAPEELKARYPKFRVPRFYRTLSEWVNTLLDAGFAIARLNEPAPDRDATRRDRGLEGDRLFAWFLQVQCRKPPTTGNSERGTRNSQLDTQDRKTNPPFSRDPASSGRGPTWPGQSPKGGAPPTPAPPQPGSAPPPAPLSDAQVGRYWNDNAEAWTQLARAGYDVYRDFLNTPAFLAMLPDVSGLSGLDVGCGYGHNTRLLAGRGARMTGLDIAEDFIRHARDDEQADPLGIDYVVASGQCLPFADASFDFVTAFMSLMDMPEPERAIREAARMLRPGGFLQFSICHPCFMTARWKWIADEAGRRIGVLCGDYFDPPQGRIDQWLFGAAPPDARAGLRKFQVPLFCRTLSEWMNMLIGAGLRIEQVNEPRADEATARRCPDVADTRIVAYFLHVRCRKPAPTPPASPGGPR